MITGSKIESFLATVVKTIIDSKDFEDLLKDDDYIAVYNNNSKFYKDETGKEKNTSYLGAIIWNTDYSIKKPNYAFPFDKNNITYPIEGETVLILKIDTGFYWLPYSKTLYPNYRQDYLTVQKSKLKEYTSSGNTNTTEDYESSRQTNIVNKKTKNTGKPQAQKEYTVDEKIKYLKPYIGDTVITGRLGNSIRLSQNFKNQSKSPVIIIRNGQSSDVTNKLIGELVEEDINNDGTSIYITSGQIQIPFKETIKKEKIGFSDYPTSDTLVGNQFYINSDRIVLSSKANEFIIFSKGNTGIITDGKYSIDAEKDIYAHTNNNIVFHSGKNKSIFLNSDGGKVFIGKEFNKNGNSYIETNIATRPNEDLQNMVLGNKLVEILERLIYSICRLHFKTPTGETTNPDNPTESSARTQNGGGKIFTKTTQTWNETNPIGWGTPKNTKEFLDILNDLQNILSKNNYLSK